MVWVRALTGSPASDSTVRSRPVCRAALLSSPCDTAARTTLPTAYSVAAMSRRRVMVGLVGGAQTESHGRTTVG